MYNKEKNCSEEQFFFVVIHLREQASPFGLR